MPGIKNFISSDFKNCLVENEKFSMYIYEGLLFLLLCTTHCILDTNYVRWREEYSIHCTVLLEQVNLSCEKLPHAG